MMKITDEEANNQNWQYWQQKWLSSEQEKINLKMEVDRLTDRLNNIKRL